MSPHGWLSLNVPVAVNISIATGSLLPTLLILLPTRKPPDKILLVPFVGVTTHCRSRFKKVTAASTGVAASTMSDVSSRRCNEVKNTAFTAMSTIAAMPMARIISISVKAARRGQAIACAPAVGA